MRNLDLNSLWRSTVGFDRLFGLIDESARWTGEENHYPPYNIERTGEDHYQIALALGAGSSRGHEAASNCDPRWHRQQNNRAQAGGLKSLQVKA